MQSIWHKYEKKYEVRAFMHVRVRGTRVQKGLYEVRVRSTKVWKGRYEVRVSKKSGTRYEYEYEKNSKFQALFINANII